MRHKYILIHHYITLITIKRNAQKSVKIYVYCDHFGNKKELVRA